MSSNYRAAAESEANGFCWDNEPGRAWIHHSCRDCSVCFYPQPPITLDVVYAAIHVSAGVPCAWSQSQVLCRSKNRPNCVPDTATVHGKSRDKTWF